MVGKGLGEVRGSDARTIGRPACRAQPVVKSERARTIVAFAAVFLIWGTTYLAIGSVVSSIPPVFMVAVRGMVAGGALYAWTRMRGGAAISGSELTATVPTAALLFGGGYVLVGWAEQQVPSGSAALLNATTPAWVVLIEWLTHQRARPTLRFAFALLLGVAGVGVLVGGSTSLPIAPSVALIAASVAWGAGTVRARANAKGNALRDASVQLLTGGLLLLPVSALTGELKVVFDGVTTESLGALAYLIMVGSLGGYTAYVWLLHHVSASKVSSHSYVNPLVAVIVGAVIAEEIVGLNTAIASALILLSVFFIVSEPARAAERAQETLNPTPRPRIAA